LKMSFIAVVLLASIFSLRDWY